MTIISNLAIIFLKLLFLLSSGDNVHNITYETNYLALGYEKGCYYQEICKTYFHTSIYINWQYGEVEKQFADDETGRFFIPITGYTVNGETMPIDYNWIRSYFKEMGISEHVFEQFQDNAHGAYYEIDGELYTGNIDGGESGWDYAYIDSYELLDDNTVQYNCIVKSYLDYDDRPFTFTLKNSNGVWELYECSDPYAFAAYFKNPVIVMKQIELEGIADKEW